MNPHLNRRKVRIVSPAKSIAPEHIDYAKTWLEANGCEVEIGRHATGSFHYFSGTDEDRLCDVQAALDDPSVDAILGSRGGYGTVRIVDQLDFSSFRHHPKLLMGYSDITVLHHRLQLMGYPSVHSTVPLHFKENTAAALQSLLHTIHGRPSAYTIPPHPYNRKGKVAAQVVGGNLSIVTSLIGTRDAIDTRGKILLLEEVGEAVYAIDRLLWTLKRAGKLTPLAGLIVGGMTKTKDSAISFGKTAEEVVREAVDHGDFPICFGFPAGHIDDNRAVILGHRAQLEVCDENSLFQQSGLVSLQNLQP